ncbi:hypothetical protein [Clostridium grantii]|uniref:Uncharacterized protein n=1 Tax=Clostridium grantii DSM 8605 TaxID=1121316 RepID=A0A1M5T4V3_9CLOT|nr:hypothetical protein [Clostridium grantii]SHH45728.1 hypothetical protein SAMN02745207_01200 [Clostridium grantii DSM 8605]
MLLPKIIEVVSYFTVNGEIKPIRFRITEDDGYSEVVRIKRVLQKDMVKSKVDPHVVFRCEALVNDSRKYLVIKFDMKSCRWYLYSLK